MGLSLRSFFCLRGQIGTVLLMTLKKFEFLLSLWGFSKPNNLLSEDHIFNKFLDKFDFFSGKLSGYWGIGNFELQSAGFFLKYYFHSCSLVQEF
jgi:hypothetical protein